MRRRAALRQRQADAGIHGIDLYGRTMYVPAAFLTVGFLGNLVVRPVARKWFMDAGEDAAGQRGGAAAARRASAPVGSA